MKKLLALLLVAALVLPGWAAVTGDDTPNGKIILSKYQAVWNVMDFDSIQSTQIDTGEAFPTNMFGNGQPYPDAVSFWIELDATGYTTLTKWDSVLIHLDISCEQDSTQLAERALAWRPIDLNGNKDTVIVGDADGSLATTTYKTGGLYTLTAAQLAQMAGALYARIRIDTTDDCTADDTARLKINMIQTYTGWISQ